MRQRACTITGYDDEGDSVGEITIARLKSETMTPRKAKKILAKNGAIRFSRQNYYGSRGNILCPSSSPMTR